MPLNTPSPQRPDPPVRSARYAIGTGEIDPALFGLESWADGSRIASRITRREALQVPAVLRARNLIAGIIGTLPIEVHNRDRSLAPDDHSSSRFLAQIDPRCPRSVTMTYTIEDLLFEGVAWWRVTGFAWDGFPATAEYVAADKVSEDPKTREVRIDGKHVPDGQLIRFTSPNPPVLVHAARAIRTALALDTTAALYSNGMPPLSYFSPMDGVDVADDDVQESLDNWEEARRTRATGYVPAALKFNKVSLDPDELQLADARQHAVLEIARATGIDPEDLGVSTTSRTYANIVDRRQDFINNTLAPYLTAVYERLSMPDVTPNGKYVRFDLDDFLKADPATRWTTYQTGKAIGALSVDEIREAEDLPEMAMDTEPAPVAVPVVPVPPPVQAPAPSDPTNIGTAGVPALTFSRVEGIAFDTPEVAAAFRVDETARTITGIAVPYGPVARSGFSTWRFKQGSLKWADPGRVKLLKDHDTTAAVGKAVQLDDRPDALWATFKVGRGEAGDAVLASAADGIVDGLSVGIDFTDDKAWIEDPADRTVRLVQRAALREVSLTAVPAFDDSRVSGVAAASTERDMTMTAPVTDPPATAPTDQAAFTAAMTEALTAAVQTVTAAVPARQVVPAGGVAFGAPVVAEQPLYAFEGRPAKHDFSSDLIDGLKGDGEKLARVTGFMRANFDVDVADAATLNPNRQRPDLYVDQLDYITPIWDAINKGTLVDKTPFVLPKFSSSSGLVAPHVEGVEPTPGAFAATSQTITPGAISGKVEITREVWDQGGNPQLSTIIWRQMVRAWDEALEVKAVEMLDALTPTAIALNGTDSDLQADVIANLVALQYIRGGNRFRDFFLASDLFGALVGAVDDNGRQLFPVLGASNAAGTTNGAFGRLLIGDLAGAPSWALETGNGGDGTSYLFSREDVHGWASTPQRLEFEYRVAYVDLAIWGYAAAACTRTDGVREVTYSAS